MKFLKQLYEMVMRVGIFPEYSRDLIDRAVSYLEDATEVTKLEGGKFSLVEKHDTYALKKNNIIVGWAKLKPSIKFGIQYYDIKMIYVLPEFRKKNVTLIFIHALKEILDHPIMVDGAVFDDGEKLIDAIFNRKMYNIFVIDKETGARSIYHPGSLTVDNTKNFLVIENEKDGLFLENTVPGDTAHKVYFSRLEDLHNIEY